MPRSSWDGIAGSLSIDSLTYDSNDTTTDDEDVLFQPSAIEALRGRTEVGEIKEAVRWAVEDGPTPLKLNHGPNTTEMYATDALWFYGTAKDQTTIEVAIETLAEDGLAGIEELVISSASEEIERYGAPYIPAFNEVSGDWPFTPRAKLAAYEFQQDRDDDEYNEDVRRFVKANDLDPENPFSDEPGPMDTNPLEEYPRQDAGVVALVYANGEELTDEMLDDIMEHQAFITDYLDNGDVNSALYSHRFDSQLPDSLLDKLDAPGDWHDDLDPQNVRVVQCEICSDRYFEVCVGGEVQFIRKGGILTDFDDRDCWYQMYQEGRRHNIDGVCSECEGSSNFYTLGINRPDHKAALSVAQGIGKDLSHENDDYDPATGEDWELLDKWFGPPHTDSDAFELRPNNEYGPTDTQDAAIKELAERSEPIEDGWFVAAASMPNGAIVLPKTNADIVHRVKEFVDDYVNQQHEQFATEATN